ncbi:hypothetical protein [Deinococcus arboris]|uniref:hypothetical protein n=1 Tax=Deinococcus arboris TaxID=2682977 RepID=UPI001E31ACF9|nr:hypothetical protein [Deinococcus arboris]
MLLVNQLSMELHLNLTTISQSGREAPTHTNPGIKFWTLSPGSAEHHAADFAFYWWAVFTYGDIGESRIGDGKGTNLGSDAKNLNFVVWTLDGYSFNGLLRSKGK